MSKKAKSQPRIPSIEEVPFSWSYNWRALNRGKNADHLRGTATISVTFIAPLQNPKQQTLDAIAILQRQLKKFGPDGFPLDRSENRG